MFLGAESLITPLFDADSHPIGTVTTSGDTRYHYLLSDNRKLWAEEGASFGDRTYAGAPKEIRCVRNLNLKMNSTNASSETTKVGSVFTYDKNTRVFNLAQMDEKTPVVNKAQENLDYMIISVLPTDHIKPSKWLKIFCQQKMDCGQTMLP